MKNILKEISIFVLIVAAIILVLAVLMYDYIPTSKVVPTTIAYDTPENLKAEIEEELIDENTEVIVTYEINGEDLKQYQTATSYKPGKQNPFAEYKEQTPSSTGGGTTTTDGTLNNGTTVENEPVSDEEFFNNSKTK